MIFEDQLHGVAEDPDEMDYFNLDNARDARAQLQAIVKSGGGVPLAYKLMSTAHHQNEKIMYVAEKACWDWYTEQTTKVKSTLLNDIIALAVS